MTHKHNLLSYYRGEQPESARRFLLWMTRYFTKERKPLPKWHGRWKQT